VAGDEKAECRKPRIAERGGGSNGQMASTE
jgi:hypothetical protein